MSSKSKTVRLAPKRRRDDPIPEGQTALFGAHVYRSTDEWALATLARAMDAARSSSRAEVIASRADY